jgi:molybdate transport system substrate-binding protein
MTGRKLITWAVILTAVLAGGLFWNGSHNRRQTNRSVPIVLAAASLQQAIEAAADQWAQQGHARPVLSFSASSALARQIEAGASADLFLSADEDWMDKIAAKQLIVPESRVTLLRNHLVLIGAKDDARSIALTKGAPLRAMLGDGRLAVADTAAVPAGKYAKAALESLDLWRDVAARLAPAENVRAALALVERGQAPLGIVYATDAKASDKVRVLGVFPDASHPPIRYPMARLAASRSLDAEALRQFLISRAARKIFIRYGFEPD